MDGSGPARARHSGGATSGSHACTTASRRCALSHSGRSTVWVRRRGQGWGRVGVTEHRWWTARTQYARACHELGWGTRCPSSAASITWPSGSDHFDAVCCAVGLGARVRGRGRYGGLGRGGGGSHVWTGGAFGGCVVGGGVGGGGGGEGQVGGPGQRQTWISCLVRGCNGSSFPSIPRNLS